MTRFDELNVITEELKRIDYSKIEPEKKKELEDDIEALLIMAWTMGNEDGYKTIGDSLNIEGAFDFGKVVDSVNHEIDGKTYIDRMREAETTADVVRIVETEYIRDYNDGVLDAGKKLGAKTKTWVTMMDDKVRETHDYLEGMTIGIDEEFFTFDGDSARYPGDFSDASNNCNCRCVLTIGK